MKNSKKSSSNSISVDDVEKLGDKSAKNKLIVSIISMILFFSVLIFFGIMTVISEKEKFSELENRNLEDFPKLSSKSFFSGEYTDDIETYLSDHFFGRDTLIKLKADIDILSGKTERNGVYIIKGKRLVQKVNEPDEEVITKSIDAINNFASENEGTPVFFMLVPTAADIYSDELPNNAVTLDEKSFIDDVYGRLSDNISSVDVYSVLSVNKDNYIYYRNDHHWTSLGAYYAYTALAKKMGFTASSVDSFDIEHASDDFRGTLYSSALYDGIKADTIDYYHPKNGYNILGEDVYKSFGEDPVHYDDIYFREYLDVKDKYSSFTGSNNPLVTLKSDSEGGKLLIIKDSYAHSLSPFLLQNYSEVTLMDLRYIQISYKDLINISDYDAVMFLYNVSTFSADQNLKKLSY